jgi:hypothetical protein
MISMEEDYACGEAFAGAVCREIVRPLSARLFDTGFSVWNLLDRLFFDEPISTALNYKNHSPCCETAVIKL